MTSDRRTILLVEDNDAIRDLVRDFMAEEGYDVVAVEDGGAAIRALEAHQPPPERLCLVILDMMLPVATGVQVLRALSALGSYVPVVAVSADRDSLRRATEAGAETTLAKPFDLDKLLDIAKRLCAT